MAGVQIDKDEMRFESSYNGIHVNGLRTFLDRIIVRHFLNLLLAFLLCATAVKAGRAAEQHDGKYLFEILNSRCTSCHSGDNAEGDFVLSVLKTVLTQGGHCLVGIKRDTIPAV